MADISQTAERSLADMYFAPQHLIWLRLSQTMAAFQEWQRAMFQYTQDLIGNRQFLDASGKTLESALWFKQRTDQAMETAVSSVQMPTKSDIELLLRRVTSLENLMRDLNDKVDLLIDREQEL